MNEKNHEFGGAPAAPADRHERLTELLERGAARALREGLRALHPAEVADWFESLPARRRDAAWTCIDPARRHDVLAEIEDAVRAGRLCTMEPEELAALADHLDEEDDLFGSIGGAVRRRLVWLGTNLATALAASWVIGRFDETIERVVALAILMPVVASMGGIAGTQTLAIAIRGIALGQLGFHNARALVGKELTVGGINGLVWAAVFAVIAGLWFGDPWIGAVAAAALLLNTVVAAFAGAALPLLLRRVSIDPALAGGVVLTTIIDVAGFAAILGLGALALA